MCLAIPGKIKSVQGQKITVEYPHETREALAGGVPLKIGDYVLIQMGVALRTITEQEAQKSWKAWNYQKTNNKP